MILLFVLKFRFSTAAKCLRLRDLPSRKRSTFTESFFKLYLGKLRANNAYFSFEPSYYRILILLRIYIRFFLKIAFRKKK
ncbi:hypothetical protein LEP1GSC161_0374 [Leptospira santarosai str. CBC1416]|uniref:Uncharacterized protein n=1 Tax=Leptospira santarosai str. CBC1416 TaxID=1193059 RepID=M6VW08_9LEPT|nr:hypothetical protein LEP1GSC161_0374 [Leptospira santarosai str. CBC1416]